MARVQLVIPDEDRDRFVHQAQRTGMTLSAWLRPLPTDGSKNSSNPIPSNPQPTLRNSSVPATHWKVLGEN